MMLIDKGYYDYDYERKEPKFKQALYEDTVKNEEDTLSMLSRFGIGATHKEESMDELQELAMKQFKEE